MLWLQDACTLHEVSQYCQFEEGNFRRRNQYTPTERLLSATLGGFLVKKASHKIYQGYLLRQILYILSLSSPFVFKLLHIFHSQVIHQLQI